MITLDMKTNLAQWGNSMGLRIPKAFAEQAGLKLGEPVEMVLEGDTIRIRKNKLTIEDLLKNYDPATRHGEMDWGAPVGKEIW